MQKIFQEYGGVITTAMAIVALIGLLGLFFTPGGTGWMDKAFHKVVNGFVNQVEEATPGRGSGDSGGSGGESDESIAHEGTIPEGGIYYVGVTSTTTGDYTGATATYVAGESFPGTATDGDVYIYEDYEYRYNYCQRHYYDNENKLRAGWGSDSTQKGWGVDILDSTKTSYSNLLNSINGVDVTSIPYTFAACISLSVAPTIPASVTNMYATFSDCTSLVDASNVVVPSNVTDVDYAFYNCEALTVMPDLSNCTSLLKMKWTFGNCVSLTDLSGFAIPSCVENMYYTFSGCTALTTAPVIPNSGSETLLGGTFSDCTSLTGEIEINWVPATGKVKNSGYMSCFSGTAKPIKIVGACPGGLMKLLANTATNGNVTYEAVA